MKRLRTILFWSHLATGLICGAVILVMSVTGAALALKPQILNWIERDVRFVPARSTDALAPRDLLAAVAAARPDDAPASLTVDRRPTSAAVVGFRSGGNVFVDPYSGALLGTGSAKANRFFQSLTTWHRYLGAEGDWRPAGRSLTGISNLAFLGLAMTGLYLWWPRALTVRYLRPILWFRTGASGRARDFNWHNTIGFWCLPAIVIMTISGSVLSYTWANNLVYRATGSPIPAARGGGRGGGEGRPGAAAPRAENARADQRVERNAPAEAAVIPERFDEVFARAAEVMPTWSVIALGLGTGERAPITLTLTDGARWNPFARSTLTVNAQTAQVVQWQPYAQNSPGQKLRGWLRFAHTGELGGLPGQIVAGVGCLGGVMLVYTGLALSVRRFSTWALTIRARAQAGIARTPTRPETI